MTTILLNDNKYYREYTGINKFHEEGYYGSRVTIASGEIWSLRFYNPDNNCIDSIDIHSTDKNLHAINTAATFFQVSPKAKLHMLYSTNGRFTNTDYDSKFFIYSTEIIEKYNITSMYTSLIATKNDLWFKDLNEWMKDHPYFKWYWASGNDNNDTYNYIVELSETFGVTASNAKYINRSYINLFAAPTSTYTNIKAIHPTDIGDINIGTSFSAPWLCGMMALVDDFFIDKTGFPLTRNAARQFMMDHSYILSKNIRVVQLPKPSSININTYTKIK